MSSLRWEILPILTVLAAIAVVLCSSFENRDRDRRLSQHSEPWRELWLVLLAAASIVGGLLALFLAR